MAAVTLTGGILIEGTSADFTEIFFVNPSLADGHDIAAVIDEEAVLVRVAEEIEGDDVALSVDRGDGLRASADPDELGFALGGLFLDPRGVGFAVFFSSEDVTGAVDDPSDGGIFTIGTVEFVHAHGGCAHEVGPPAVVAILLHAEIFPLPKCWSAAEDDVLFRTCWSAKGEQEEDGPDLHAVEDDVKRASDQDRTASMKQSRAAWRREVWVPKFIRTQPRWPKKAPSER